MVSIIGILIFSSDEQMVLTIRLFGHFRLLRVPVASLLGNSSSYKLSSIDIVFVYCCFLDR